MQSHQVVEDWVSPTLVAPAPCAYSHICCLILFCLQQRQLFDTALCYCPHCQHFIYVTQFYCIVILLHWYYCISATEATIWHCSLMHLRGLLPTLPTIHILPNLIVVLLSYCIDIVVFLHRGKNSKLLSAAVERLLPSMPTLYVAQFYCYCYWYCCIPALLSSTEVKLCSPLQLRGCCPHCQHFTYICCLNLYCDFY